MTALGIPAGTVIGRDFRVVQHLASGAMGAVYVVEQLSTGKQRALKVMSIDLANNDRARERFVLEARVGAKVDSDHVVEVVTAGFDEGTGAPYLVMELLRGEELADKVYREGRLPLPMVAEILRQAGHALEQAHAQGIVHRDLKPENLFIAESRRDGVPFTVKILDFGIAKLVAERTSEGTQPVGTPLFMAPEQTDRRGLIGPPTDVWPLGLIAYLLLTGQHYWLGADQGITTLLREVVMEPLAPPSERAAAQGLSGLLPVGFDDWFMRCVNRDPRQRWPEAGACARAFCELVPGALASAPGLTIRGDAHPGAATLGRLPTMATDAQSFGVGPSAAASAGGTGLTAASSMDASQAQSGGKAGLWVGGLVALAALGTGIFFVTRSDGEPDGEEVASAPTPSASEAPSPSASAAPAGPATCPDGMVRIEAGSMFMGSTDDDLDDDVRPPHKVKVAAFCLDKTEVTTRDYDRCANDGHCLRPQPKVSFPNAKPAEIEALSPLCNHGQADKASHPMNCVTWDMAKQFCEGEGGRLAGGGARLPTEAEWEFAARGSGQRVYPWGDEPPGPTRLNACGSECAAWLKSAGLESYGQMFEADDGHAATAPVGSFPAGASTAGVLDLAGNVWEWTADWYGPYGSDAAENPTGPDSGTDRVVRGGGFNGLRPAWAKPAYRWHTTPETSSHGIGFRCAKSL